MKKAVLKEVGTVAVLFLIALFAALILDAIVPPGFPEVAR